MPKHGPKSSRPVAFRRSKAVRTKKGGLQLAAPLFFGVSAGRWYGQQTGLDRVAVQAIWLSRQSGQGFRPHLRAADSAAAVF